MFEVTADHVTIRAPGIQGEQSNRRLWFIFRNNPRTQAEWEHVSSLAKCWFYAKKYNCQYNNVIQKKINE